MVIVPFRGTFWLLLRTARVVTVRASAVIVSAIAANAVVFLECVLKSFTNYITSLKY